MFSAIFVIFTHDNIKIDIEIERSLIGTEYFLDKEIYGDDVEIYFSGIKELYPFCPENNKLYGYVYEQSGLKEPDKYTYSIGVLFQSSKYEDSCIEITYHQENEIEKKYYRYSFFTDIDFTEFILICYDDLEENEIDEEQSIQDVDYRIITSIDDKEKLKHYFNNRNNIFSK